MGRETPQHFTDIENMHRFVEAVFLHVQRAPSVRALHLDMVLDWVKTTLRQLTIPDQRTHELIGWFKSIDQTPFYVHVYSHLIDWIIPQRHWTASHACQRSLTKQRRDASRYTRRWKRRRQRASSTRTELRSFSL